MPALSNIVAIVEAAFGCRASRAAPDPRFDFEGLIVRCSDGRELSTFGQHGYIELHEVDATGLIVRKESLTQDELADDLSSYCEADSLVLVSMADAPTSHTRMGFDMVDAIA